MYYVNVHVHATSYIFNGGEKETIICCIKLLYAESIFLKLSKFSFETLVNIDDEYILCMSELMSHAQKRMGHIYT